MHVATSSLLAALFILSSCGVRPAAVAEAAEERPAPSPDDVVVAFWNVENLFDSEDDASNAGDDEYLPENGWNAARYATKLDHLATVIATTGPHVLGVAEVENRRVLEDLAAHPRLANSKYGVAHLDSPDKRGIDLALLYRAPFALAGDAAQAVRHHPIVKEGELPTRGILEVTLEAQGAPLTVLVNHWPSRGSDRDGSFRQIAGATVRRIVDERGHDTDLLVIGDLNDDPFDHSVRRSLGAIRSRNAVLNRRDPKALYNPSWQCFGKTDEGTLYYNREWVWNVFDQIICSRGLLDSAGFQYVDGSLSTHAPAELRDHYRRPKRFRKGRDGTWNEGFSDHFMVHCRLRKSDS